MIVIALALKGIDYEYKPVHLLQDGGQQVSVDKNTLVWIQSNKSNLLFPENFTAYLCDLVSWYNLFFTPVDSNSIYKY